MKSNIVGQLAWVLLGILGLFSTVDLGFGPILICPKCGSAFNAVAGIVLIAVSAAAIVTNRKVKAAVHA